MDNAVDHSNTRYGDLIVFFSAQCSVLGDFYSNDLEGSRGSGETLSRLDWQKFRIPSRMSLHDIHVCKKTLQIKKNSATGFV